MTALPNKSGIYAILNLQTQKHYVGSAVNFRLRKGVHLHALRRGTHHCSKLQRAFSKYGEESFRFDILELVEARENLVEREQYWLDVTRPFYNSARVAGSTLGRIASPETRAKISASRMGQKRGEFSAEHRANISAATRGKKHKPLSEAQKAQISVTQKASWTEAKRERYRKLARSRFTGGHHTEESKEAQREAKAVYRYRITSPEGEVEETISMTAFCRLHPDLHACAMLRAAHGKQSKHKGWSVTMEPIKNCHDAEAVPA